MPASFLCRYFLLPLPSPPLLAAAIEGERSYRCIRLIDDSDAAIARDADKALRVERFLPFPTDRERRGHYSPPHLSALLRA